MSNIAGRIALFNEVRDIPYRIDLVDRSKDSSCITKVILLKELLKETYAIESRRICCHYYWNTTRIPRGLIAQAPGPHSYHEYLKVFVPETRNWVAIDPTLDAGLRKAGFPIAEWDGLNSTVLAVTPFQTFSPHESQRTINSTDQLPPEIWSMHYRQHRPFFDGLNAWFERQRHVLGVPHA